MDKKTKGTPTVGTQEAAFICYNRGCFPRSSLGHVTHTAPNHTHHMHPSLGGCPRRMMASENSSWQKQIRSKPGGTHTKGGGILYVTAALSQYSAAAITSRSLWAREGVLFWDRPTDCANTSPPYGSAGLRDKHTWPWAKIPPKDARDLGCKSLCFLFQPKGWGGWPTRDQSGNRARRPANHASTRCQRRSPGQ